jgi:DnaJ domain
MQGLDALVEGLAELCDDTGTWSIRSDEVAALLGVDPVRFWRTVHGLRDRIGFADAIDGWTQETVGDLVTVLEGLYGKSAEEAMTRAGLFIPWNLGIDLIEELLFRGRRLSAAHELQEDELEAMLRHFGSVRKAVDVYLETHVDLNGLVDGCAESFRVLRDLPPEGAITAAAWLRRMFTRHVLVSRSLLVGLEERIRIAAAQMGFIDPEDHAHPGREGAPRTSRESARRAWARKVMGLPQPAVSAEDLRARYRQLMMRYHPDADPAGLEKCKDVNVAYSLLISEAAAQS